jgi:hypothetical protein
MPSINKAICVNLAVALLGSSTLAASAAQTGQYRYTQLSDCKEVKSARDEGGYVRSTCPGVGGYRLERIEADGRENLIVVTPQGKKHNLGLPSHSGGGFTSLGDTIEWRGRLDGKVLRPTAMIIRYKVVEDANRPDRPASYLLGVSLVKMPCVAAKVAPGRNQNERARAVVDGRPSCL